MSDLKCPWCKSEISEPEMEDFRGGDGSTSESECPECDKQIEFTLRISVDFEVAAIGCEKHVFSNSDHFWLFKDEIDKGKDFSIACDICSAEFYTWHLPTGSHPKLKEGQYEFTGKALEVAKSRGWVK